MRTTSARAGIVAVAGALLGAGLTLPAAPVGAADALGAAAAIAALNAQRAANGIPGDLTERPDWSAGCAAHVNYVALNGDDPGNAHDETPGKPGYTPAGQAAARSSVLGGTWRADGADPYEAAPIHLMALLAPGLAQTGYAPGCMWTWPGYTRPEPEITALFSYPGPNASIYAAEVAAESPFVPGDFVGLPAGTTTGPHLYVFAFGQYSGDVTITSVQLTGPRGGVAVATVDNSTTGAAGDLGSYLPPGGIVIPRQPLQVGASYRAVVDGRADNLHDSYICTDLECHDDPAYQPTVPVHWEWTFRAIAGTARTPASAPPGQPGGGTSGTGGQPGAGAAQLAVAVAAVRHNSRLRVDVDPDRGPYRVTIQRLRHGKWVTYRKIRTKGPQDQRTVNLPKGTYRALARTQKGYQGNTSVAVRLAR